MQKALLAVICRLAMAQSGVGDRSSDIFFGKAHFWNQGAGTHSVRACRYPKP